MNNYNFSIKHREEFDVSSQRIWDIISEPSNLNHYHPFCKNNDIISWDGENHHDRLEYLNGVVIERKFISWHENSGYDLFIGRKNGRQSHVSWRIEDISENKSALTIKVQNGTAIYLLHLRHPIHVAHATATLDQLSGGRFIFGVGVGTSHESTLNESMNLGVPFSKR